MASLKITGSYNLDRLIKNHKRYHLMVGGSRSGKTFATLQWIVLYCFQHTGKTITICKKTFPSLRMGAYEGKGGFIDLLKNHLNIYDESRHNKSNNSYQLNGNTIQFIAVDQSDKLRGVAHDIVLMDEINDFDKPDFDQIAMRTTDMIIMTQNPSNADHFSLVYKDHPDSTYTHSTYKDNPFLEQGLINQIESYKDTDADWWAIYGLGIPGNKNSDLIYTHHKIYTDKDDMYNVFDGQRYPKYTDIIYGLDFGWNHPTALIKIYINTDKKQIWCEEAIYSSYMTTDDLIAKMRCDTDITPYVNIYCDSAEPKTIESLVRAGYNATKSNKEVLEGINCIKSCEFNVHYSSTNIQTELKRYKWKMKGEVREDEPVRLFDDGLCAIRYAVYTYLNKNGGGYLEMDVFDL